MKNGLPLFRSKQERCFASLFHLSTPGSPLKTGVIRRVRARGLQICPEGRVCCRPGPPTGRFLNGLLAASNWRGHKRRSVRATMNTTQGDEAILKTDVPGWLEDQPRQAAVPKSSQAGWVETRSS